MTMLIYDNIYLFVRLVELGSYTKTAEEAHISAPTITRRIQELEENLNTILLLRTTRTVSLTKDGEVLYLKFRDLYSNLNEVLHIYNKQAGSESNSLKVLLPMTLSTKLINPHIKLFKDKNPNIDLHIQYDSSKPDLDNDNFDLVLTHHKINDPKYDYRFLRKEAIKLYCTPEYIKEYGHPKNVNELSLHEVINGIESDASQNLDYMIFTNKYTQEKTYHNMSYSKIKVNTLTHAKEIGLSGLAIFGSWDFLCRKELEEGKLVQVLPDYDILDVNFYLISRKKLRQVEQDFIEFLHKCMNSSIRQQTQQPMSNRLALQN